MSKLTFVLPEAADKGLKDDAKASAEATPHGKAHGHDGHHHSHVKMQAVVKPLSAPVLKCIEPVGLFYNIHKKRTRAGRSMSEDARQLKKKKLEQEALSSESLLDMSNDEPVSAELLRADPKDWKSLDLYAILGLSSKRWQANEDDIRKAYRRRVLKHHPDKKAAESGDSNADSFFKCIQKANEVITNPTRRRQFDSVDPTFDDAIPSAKAKGDFFKLYRHVFDRNARFSKEANVPSLGDASTSRDDVEHFYNFWSDFDSWRTFEWKDEKDVEGVDGRDEKRHIEKQNKAARQRLKKEDNARILRLVDQAVRADPRLVKFKEMDKQAREAKKNKKEKEVTVNNEQQVAEDLQAKKDKEAQDVLDKQRQEEEKKDREAMKKNMKRDKKTLKGLFKDYNYFLEDPNSDIQALTQRLDDFDKMLEARDADKLQIMAHFWQAGLEEARQWWDRELKGQNEGLQAPAAPAKLEKAPAESTAASNQNEKTGSNQREWTSDELKWLVEAVKKFPPGSKDRWDSISAFIATHTQEPARSSVEIINQSKYLATLAPDQLTSILHKPTRKNMDHLRLVENPSLRDNTAETPVEDPETKSLLAAMGSEWTSVEQQQLEAAMKNFPASKFKGNSRWDKITSKVKGRTVDQVKARVKYLQIQVQKKRQG